MKARPALAVALLCAGCLPLGGPGHVTVLGESDQSDTQIAAQAAALAASIASRLRDLEGSLGNWEECLNKGTCSRRKFLSSCQATELEILAAPELAALRDWVREGYRTAELQLESGGTGGTPSSSGGFRPVALHAGQTRVQSPPAGGLVAWVRGLVSRPRELAESNDLITNICIVSTPSEAAFRMWPSSDPARTSETRTTGRVTNAYRGSYAFAVTKGSVSYECPGQQRCAKLDLVNDPQPVFNCSLSDRVCRRQATASKGCDD